MIKEWIQKHHISVTIIPRNQRPVRMLQLNLIFLIMGGVALAGSLIGGTWIALKSTPHFAQNKSVTSLGLNVPDLELKIQQLLNQQAHLQERVSRLVLPDGTSPFSDPTMQQLLNPEPKSRPQIQKQPKSTQVDSLGRIEAGVSQLQQKIATWEWIRESIPSGWPIEGRVSSQFGFRLHPLYGEPHFHRGLDIVGQPGTPIKVVADGTVAYSGWGGSYGNVVLIVHALGYSTLYGHTELPCVRVGQQVTKGQVIAWVGSTGASTGAHLHYEVRRFNQPVQPEAYMKNS